MFPVKNVLMSITSNDVSKMKKNIGLSQIGQHLRGWVWTTLTIAVGGGLVALGPKLPWDAQLTPLFTKIVITVKFFTWLYPFLLRWMNGEFENIFLNIFLWTIVPITSTVQSHTELVQFCSTIFDKGTKKFTFLKTS
jgi:hypothetical protein